MPENKKLALNSEIQTYRILKNDDEVCIPRLFSILLAVLLFSNSLLLHEWVSRVKLCVLLHAFQVQSVTAKSHFL